jgi:hypothetical protein
MGSTITGKDSQQRKSGLGHAVLGGTYKSIFLIQGSSSNARLQVSKSLFQ